MISLIQTKVLATTIWKLFIKKVKIDISKPLTQIFDLSLSSGVVPDKLKVAKVIPIYKKDDSALFSNYRPVSLLPCFLKSLKDLYLRGHNWVHFVLRLECTVTLNSNSAISKT